MALDFSELASKGSDLVKNLPTNAKVGIGIGGAGLITMGIGGIVGSGSDSRYAKAEKLERKARSKEGTGHGLVVAGAIATAGVGGYGIAQAISHMK